MFPRVAVAPGPGPEVREVAIKVESVAGVLAGARPRAWRSSATRSGRTGSGGWRASGRAWRWSSGGGTRDSSPSPASSPARAGCGPRPRATPWPLASSGRRGDGGSTTMTRGSTRPRRPSPVSSSGPARPTWPATSSSRSSATTGSRGTSPRRVQKARQDRLGLGWANHDHHTFRCSRRFFPRVIRMFESLGFFLRERFHAGEHAGWARQILEHPTTGVVIFADLDLAPEEATRDFAHRALPDLRRPNTVGLWVGLHGESILEAGMHHLEAQFDFDALRAGSESRGGDRGHEAVLRLPLPPPGLHRGRALAGRPPGGPTAAWPWAGSARSSTPSSSATGRSAATSKTSSAARASRASTSRPSAPSSRRPTPGSTEPGRDRTGRRGTGNRPSPSVFHKHFHLTPNKLRLSVPTDARSNSAPQPSCEEKQR